MRRYGFRAAMLSTWRANVLQTASSLSRFGLGRNRERRFPEVMCGRSHSAAVTPARIRTDRDTSERASKHNAGRSAIFRVFRLLAHGYKESSDFHLTDVIG